MPLDNRNFMNRAGNEVLAMTNSCDVFRIFSFKFYNSASFLLYFIILRVASKLFYL